MSINQLQAKCHLLLVALLQKLHVAASLAVRPPQGGAAVLQQVRGRGHAAALGVHPGVDVVGDVAPGDPAHRAHGETKLFAAL